LCRKTELELIIGYLKKCEELASEHTNIAFVDESVGQFKSPTANRYVTVPKAIENDVTVPLDSVGVHTHYFVKSIESDVSAQV
jgi:hypothetical protein